MKWLKNRIGGEAAAVGLRRISGDRAAPREPGHGEWRLGSCGPGMGRQGNRSRSWDDWRLEGFNFRRYITHKKLFTKTLSYSLGQHLSNPPWQTERVKNRFEHKMDPELQRKIEGLTQTQIAVFADVLVGLAEYLRHPEPDIVGFWLPSKPGN